jgi:hypothetical protein
MTDQNDTKTNDGSQQAAATATPQQAAPPPQAPPQKPVSALDRLEGLERSVGSCQQMFRYLAQKQTELEVSLAGLAKALNGVAEALKEKSILVDEDIMKHIRALDDKSGEEQVRTMIRSKVIKPAARVSSSSLVVVSRQELRADGSTLKIADYSTLSMPHTKPEAPEFKALLGKAIGDRYELRDREDLLLCMIQEIYDYQVNGGSEPQAEEPPQQTAPAPAEPAADAAAPEAATPIPPAAASPSHGAEQVTTPAADPATP